MNFDDVHAAARRLHEATDGLPELMAERDRLDREIAERNRRAIEARGEIPNYLACLDCGQLLDACICAESLPDCPCGGKPREYVCRVPTRFGVDCTAECGLDTLDCQTPEEAREDWKWIADAIVWTGDLEDDCTARWRGLVLRAEAMDDDEWWWTVIDADGDDVDTVWEHLPEPATGEEARRAAERAAREWLRKASAR